MNINWRRATDKIIVPEELATRAIRQGIAQGATKRRHHRIEVLVIAALICFVAMINPLTMQAGGVVPAVRQLLDIDGKKTHYFDPTMNQVFGALSDATTFHRTQSPVVTAGGIKIQVIGTMASAGMQGLVIDYVGPHIDPAALRRQKLQISINQHTQVMDLEQNYAQIALGHYRQFIAFYVDAGATTKSPAVCVHINQVNGTRSKVTLPSVQVPTVLLATRQLQVKSETAAKGVARIDRVISSPQSFVVEYAVEADLHQISVNQASQIKKGAWLSEAEVVVNKKVIGTLMLGLGGMKIHETQSDGIYVGHYQSIFANQCDLANSDRTVPLNQVSDAAMVHFKVQIPGKGSNGHRFDDLIVPIRNLIPAPATKH